MFLVYLFTLILLFSSLSPFSTSVHPVFMGAVLQDPECATPSLNSEPAAPTTLSAFPALPSLVNSFSAFKTQFKYQLLMKSCLACPGQHCGDYWGKEG